MKILGGRCFVPPPFPPALPRYGSHWGDWRRCGFSYGDEEERIPLELAGPVTAINGSSGGPDGHTHYLEVVTEKTEVQRCKKNAPHTRNSESPTCTDSSKIIRQI